MGCSAESDGGRRGTAARVILTETRMANLSVPAEGRVYVHDAQTRGLVVCLAASGSKTFEFYGRLGGRPARFKIGRWPDITVEHARNEVAKVHGAVAEGKDPRDTRLAGRGEMTFAELWAWYLEKHAKPHKKSWPEDEGLYRRHLAPWATRKISGVTRSTAETLHQKIGSTRKYEANRMLSLLHTIYSKAIRAGLYTGPNPAAGVQRFDEVPRERFLQVHEVRRFFEALRNDLSETYRDLFLVLLFTGARRGNVQTMQWNDLDLEGGTWTIPDTKAGRPQVVALHPEVVTILRSRQEGAGAGPWVFAGRRSGHYVGEPAKAWRRVLAAANLKNLRMHDLRRTMGSWAAAGGASLHMIGQALGHHDQATTAIYARLNLDPVRKMVNATVDALLAAGNGAAPALPPVATKEQQP